MTREYFDSQGRRVRPPTLEEVWDLILAAVIRGDEEERRFLARCARAKEHERMPPEERHRAEAAWWEHWTRGAGHG